MKTIIKSALFLVVIASLSLVSSCSKERIESQVQTEYANLDDFYDLNEPEEQTFLIDSTGGDTITGTDGTKIWGIPKTIFMVKSTQQDISYPYTLKLIEAYSIKYMIMSRLPGVAQGGILHSAGDVKITAFKNADELALKENNGLNFMAPSANPVNGMGLFYGFTNGTTNDWNNDVLQTDYLFGADNVTTVSNMAGYYHALTAKLGWMNIAKTTTPTAQATVNFTAAGTNTNFIDVYIVFDNLHNYVKVNNLTASNLPSGEAITVFAIAKDASGTMYYFKNNYTISNGLTIDLVMNASTEAQVLSELDAL